MLRVDGSRIKMDISPRTSRSLRRRSERRTARKTARSHLDVPKDEADREARPAKVLKAWEAIPEEASAPFALAKKSRSRMADPEEEDEEFKLAKENSPLADRARCWNEEIYSCAATEEHRRQYRRHLDILVARRRKSQERERARSLEIERKLLAQPSPFGRPGPGGVPWRDPKLLGVRFLQSMGWTGKSMAGRLHARDVDPLPITETNRFFDDKSGHGAVSDVYPRGTELQARSPRCRNMHNEEVQVYELTGGVELVPLMTTRRYQSQPQTTRFLATDATRPGYTIEALRALGTGNKEYISALAEQIRGKRERIMEEERKERESCRRHFDTWRGFWGRPGHGAPLDHTQRVKLYDILYRPPIVY